MKCPDPPNVGDVFIRTHAPHQKPELFHVRAIVDLMGDDPDFGPQYWIVFRRYSRSRGWQYLIESSIALGVGLYKPRSKGAT